MDDLVFPTWADVGITDFFLQNLKSASDRVLEQLYQDRVGHAVRKLQYVYACGVCGHKHKPNKITDDYSVCEACKSRCIRLTQQLKALSATLNPIHDSVFAETIRVMNASYQWYFGEKLEIDIVKFGWRNNVFGARFLSGELVEGPNIGVTIAKAAYLTPFLWDLSYDWKEHKHRRSTGQRSHLTPMIHEFSKQKLKAKRERH